MPPSSATRSDHQCWYHVSPGTNDGAANKSTNNYCDLRVSLEGGRGGIRRSFSENRGGKIRADSSPEPLRAPSASLRVDAELTEQLSSRLTDTRHGEAGALASEQPSSAAGALNTLVIAESARGRDVTAPPSWLGGDGYRFAVSLEVAFGDGRALDPRPPELNFYRTAQTEAEPSGEPKLTCGFRAGPR